MPASLLPAPVLDLLRSLTIVPPPSPTMSAGDRFELTLDPDLKTFASLVGRRPLASIDVNAILDRVTLSALPPALPPEWTPNTGYTVGAVVRAPGPGLPPPTNYYICVNPGTSGATAPLFPTVPGSTISEGSAEPQRLSWLCATFPAPIGVVPGTTELEVSLSSFPPIWAADSEYKLGSVVRPPTDNGFYYLCTVPGRSGGNPPPFPVPAGSTITEGESNPQLTWKCIPSPGDGNFALDLHSFPRSWQDDADYEVGTVIRPPVENGYYYLCTVPGRSGGEAPEFPSTVGDLVSEGPSDPKLTWRCLRQPGDTSFRLELDSVPTEGKPPPGSADLTLGDGLEGTIKGTVTQVEKMAGPLTGSLGQVQHLAGALTGTVGQPFAASGTVSGTIQQVLALVGSIVGKLEGSIDELLLKAAPQITVTWCFGDESGAALPAGKHIIPETEGWERASDNTSLSRKSSDWDSVKPPVVVFLPEFTEYDKKGEVDFARRSIRCKITVEATDFKPESIHTPAVVLTIPKVQLPTVLVLTEHTWRANEDPGAMLVGVPTGSPIRGWNDEVRSELRLILGAVLGVAEKLAAVLPSGNEYVHLVQGLGKLIERLSSPFRFIRENSVDDLWWIDIPERWPENFEGIITGLMLVAVPGNKASCYNRDSFMSNYGAFTMTTGLSGAAIIETLEASKDKLRVVPPTAVLEFEGDETRSPGHEKGTPYNDSLGSYNFGPIPEFYFVGGGW